MNNSNNPLNPLQEAVQKYQEALGEVFGKEAVKKALQEMEASEQEEESLPQPQDSQLPERQNRLGQLFASIQNIFHPREKDPIASEKNPNFSQVLKLLHARDAVQERLEEKPSFEEISSYSSDLIHLDQFLKDRSNVIAQNENLIKAHNSLKPSASHWWWFLEVKQIDPWWSTQDWLWNVFTVVVLAVASSNIIITARAFSKGGFDWFGAFTTVVQSGVVVAFAGGALTDKGHKLAEDVLTNLKIPKNLHAEATFVMSAGFCALTYGGTQNLPLVGAHYYRQGQMYEKKLRWESAKDQYERALNFLPDDPKIYVALGNTYEFLSDLPNAQKFYKSAFDQGDSASAIRFAKILVIQVFDKTMWEKPTNKSESQDKIYQQEEQKYKFKQDVERETKLEETERALDVAEVRINENIQTQVNKNVQTHENDQTQEKKAGQQTDKDQKSDFKDKIKNTENLRDSDKKQLGEIKIIRGLLKLLKVDIGDKDSVSGYLSDSLISFKDATKIAPSLNDLAQCYTYLTTLAREKINIYNSKTSPDEGDFSGAIDKFLIQPLNSNDIAEITHSLMILASLTNDSKLKEQVKKELEEQANNEERERLKSQYINALANYLSLTTDELREKNDKQALKDLLYRKRTFEKGHR